MHSTIMTLVLNENVPHACVLPISTAFLCVVLYKGAPFWSYGDTLGCLGVSNAWLSLNTAHCGLPNKNTQINGNTQINKNTRMFVFRGGVYVEPYPCREEHAASWPIHEGYAGTCLQLGNLCGPSQIPMPSFMMDTECRTRLCARGAQTSPTDDTRSRNGQKQRLEVCGHVHL